MEEDVALIARAVSPPNIRTSFFAEKKKGLQQLRRWLAKTCAKGFETVNSFNRSVFFFFLEVFDNDKKIKRKRTLVFSVVTSSYRLSKDIYCTVDCPVLRSAFPFLQSCSSKGKVGPPLFSAMPPDLQQCWCAFWSENAAQIVSIVTSNRKEEKKKE